MARPAGRVRGRAEEAPLNNRYNARPAWLAYLHAALDRAVRAAHGWEDPDPTDLGTFAAAIHRLLADPVLAARLGTHAKERVRTDYLGLRHLMQYADLLARIDPPR